ncbi:hypothetical protein ABZX98_32885 [Streptomyces sp. NPDC002992]|uniref:hypothetical protein n=1 Tax=Streptomyces sp. NPDC002992 TaxID=3154273 RepID=UPI0033BE7F6D
MNETPSGGTAQQRRPAAGAVRPELAEALRAQGADGERALGLLLDAAYMLDHRDDFQRASEVAHSCVRGALDSVLKLAGEDFPGPQRAARALKEAAGAVADSWHERGKVPPGLVDSLLAAVEEVRAQEADQGGFRVRQVEHLVLEQTRQEMGLAEKRAARDSWSTFYSAASAVLHGSNSTVDAGRQLAGVVAALEELFLGLPERADRLRELAGQQCPSQQDADEVARMTDPRAGAYFFRAAVSDRWLGLLPVERLLPEERRWPAAPYLRRLLARDPELVCAWVQARLEAISGQGAGALSQAVSVVAEGGAAAGALLERMVREYPERYVQVRVADWAHDVPVSDRDGVWVRVVERVLGSAEFTKQEEWETGQLLAALQATAHPEGRLRGGGDRLGVIIRSSLAGVLAGHLERNGAPLEVELCNDLGSAEEVRSAHSAAVVLMRAVLDLALAEARLGVPVDQRLQAVRRKPVGAQVRARLVAVHLAESFTVDAESGAAAAWWREAVEAAGQIGCGRWPCADVSDFVALVAGVCPDESREVLKGALVQGLGIPPAQREISEWEGVDEPVPDAWRIVRGFSAVLPDEVLAGWRPVLSALQQRFGQAPARPESVVKFESWVESHGGLSLDTFAALAQEQGPAAAVAELADTAVPRLESDEDGDEVRAGLLGELVAQDPARWAGAPAEVAAAAGRPTLQAAYFNALHRAAGEDALEKSVVAQVTEAAFAVRPLQGGQGRTAQLAMVVSNLLHRTWSGGGSVQDDAEAVAWLSGLVEGWAVPRLGSHSPLFEAVYEPGGSALLSLIVWGTRSERDGSGLPEGLTAVLDSLLTGEPDDRALAVIGFVLGQLWRADTEWVEGHAGALLPLNESWRPARVWLARGRQLDHRLLASLDRSGLFDVLAGWEASGEGEGSLDKTLNALLQESMPLGPPAGFLTGLADRTGGAQAISTMLSLLATALGNVSEEDREWAQRRAVELWQTVLDARLPCEALRGAGRFAFAETFDEDTWLELTARTVAQQPDLDDSDRVVKRAARTPDSAYAQVIAAAALGTAPVDGHWRGEIIRYAGDLFAGASEGGSEYEVLRVALINAGAIEAAYRD